MKNKYSIFTFISFLIFFQFQAFCQESSAKLSIAPEFGFVNGKIVEDVWNIKASTSGNTITYTPTTKMSRLDWQMENSFYFGFNSDLVINDKLNFWLSFKNAISRDCGVMEDYDWLNPVTSAWKDDPADELTNYSIHINHLENMIQTTLCAGWTFYLNQSKSISLTPRFGFEFEDISFCGNDGWGTYKSNNWQKTSFEDKVISYSQWFIAPVLALNADFNIGRYFETTLDLSVIWIKNLDCIDRHYIRSLLFNDRIEDVWKLGAELNLFYKLNKMNKIGLKGNISFMPEAYGFTYSSKTDTSPDASTMGGTNRLLWTYAFVYVLSF